MHCRTKSARTAHHITLKVLCIRFLPQTQTNLKLRTRAPKSIPTTNITVLLMSSTNLISLRTRTIYGTWFQQLVYHSTILMIDTLCPISTLKQQLANLEQTHTQCSLHCKGWTVKKGLRVSFAFFQ